MSRGTAQRPAPGLATAAASLATWPVTAQRREMMIESATTVAKLGTSPGTAQSLGMDSGLRLSFLLHPHK